MVSKFIYTTSQVGAEPIIKAEVAKQFPDANLAFSRPGLLTFKLSEDEMTRLENSEAVAPLRSVFARTWGFSLGSLRGETVEELIPKIWELTGEMRFDRVHVFSRDIHKVGDYKFEPRITEEATEICEKVASAYPFDTLKAHNQCEPAQEGELVLDVVLVNPQPPERVREFLERRREEEESNPDFVPENEEESGTECVSEVPESDLPKHSRMGKKFRGKGRENGPHVNEWLIGWHRVRSFQSAFPGGMLDLEVPEEVVSRAWLKMEEALRWSHFPIEDARVCEIGSAPGGATQALLARGCEVMGVDPAEMDPIVLENPKFRHIRSRIAFVKRREFRRVRWLTCDINVPPNYTLDVIESVVTHPEVSVRGMLLTLKFPDWNMGFDVGEYIARIKSWGFNIVHARQLHYSHQEICVACLKKPFKK